MVAVAVVMVELIRPVTPSGIGSIYYLAYALGSAEFDTLWAVVANAVPVSIAMHEVTTTAIMSRLHHRR